MKRVVFFMLACMYVLSCTSPVDDGNYQAPVQDEQSGQQENPEQSENQQEPLDTNFVGELGPSWYLLKSSLISEHLRVRNVDKFNSNYNDGDSVSPSDMLLIWSPERNDEDSGYHMDNLLGLSEDDYNKLVENIKNALNSAPNPDEQSLIHAVYAGIRSITITADKVLFGRESGQDLSDKFMIDQFLESMILLSYPEGNVIKGYNDDKSMTVAEWSKMGCMLYSFRTHYAELPEEKHTEVTFTMTIETTEDTCLTGSVTVKFV